MKSFLSFATVALLTSEADARNTIKRPAPSSYSKMVLNRAFDNHHYEYGVGGADFAEAFRTSRAERKQHRGKALKTHEHQLMSNIKEKNGKKYYYVNGQYFSASASSTGLIAFFFSMQFDANEEFNSCTLCATDMAKTAGYYVADAKPFKYEKMYNLIVYDTIHMAGNFSALYEYCDLYRMIQFAANILPSDFSDGTAILESYDWGALGQTLTRTITAFAVDLVDEFEDLKFAEASLDYMMIGDLSGQIFEIVFDTVQGMADEED
jgi:hypothetical protein